MTRDTTRSFNRVRLPKGPGVVPCPSVRIQQIRSRPVRSSSASLKPIRCGPVFHVEHWLSKSKYRECAPRTRKRQAVGVDGHGSLIGLRDGLELGYDPL